MLSKKIPVFGIAFKDEEKNILDFLKTFGNPYDKIGMDKNGFLGIEWGVYGIPETFIINKKDQIIYKYTGPLEVDELEKNIIAEYYQRCFGEDLPEAVINNQSNE